MSVISFEGQADKGGIPDEAHVRIEACSGKVTPAFKDEESGATRSLKARNKDVVFNGNVTGGLVNINLDPGLYAYKIRHMPEDGVGQVSYGGDFYHGCTATEFKKISHMKPLHSRAMMTSDGMRFTCIWLGCNKKHTSRIAALLHESEVHYGRSLLGSDQAQDVKNQIDREFKEKQESLPPKRGPGRPPNKRA